jgi:hypothetical protein
MNISDCINEFINGSDKNAGRHKNERYASFDYCYNYFYNHYKDNRLQELTNSENIEKSCLQLGFYLASWGMLRGSSFLLQKSVKHFEETIFLIANTKRNLWEIDVDKYNSENINLILNMKQEIIKSLGKQYNPSDTLVTKIMMGVFANIPAFDQYFKKGLSVGAVNKESLERVFDFYKTNQKEIDNRCIYTIDYNSGNNSNIKYTKAKIIDMYGFVAGSALLR